ncbi:MAG: DUF6642 family protein [Saprospiraceae bacterium]
MNEVTLTNQKNIFVLEGEWSDDNQDKRSVNDLLNFLSNVLNVDYFHRRVATKKEFSYHLKNSLDNHYEIVYLAFHGWKGFISSEGFEIDIDDLYKYKRKFQGKIIHFGSCQTLKLSKDKLIEIKENLGAKYISGYTKNVDWVDSALLEIAYFNYWQYYKKRGVDLDKALEKDYKILYNRLGFIMV